MTQFFAYPLNYGTGRSQYKAVADNDYNTFTAQLSMLINIDTAGDGSGTARDFTDIFIKCSGVASYSAALTNPANITSPQARTLPDALTNDSGDTVPITIDGLQNDLFSVWTDESTSKPKAKAMTLTFTAKTGQSVRVYEVMVLNRLLTLKAEGRFSRIEYNSIDLGTVEPDLRKRLSYVPAINGERDKWAVNLTLLSPRLYSARERLSDQLISFIRKNKAFVFAPEYTRYPDRVFPAVWPNPETQIRYLSRWKGGGRRVSFSVREA